MANQLTNRTGSMPSQTQIVEPSTAYNSTGAYPASTADPLSVSVSSQLRRPVSTDAAAALRLLVEKHGGALDDSRATVVRSVGQRLMVANGLSQLPVRFDVLDDSENAVAYTMASGNVLVTAGMVDRIRVQEKIAAVLARQIEKLLASRVASVQTGVAERLLESAGFQPTLLYEMDHQVASWRIAADQQTVLASHVAPL